MTTQTVIPRAQRFERARHELTQAMNAENVCSYVFMTTTMVLACLGTSMPATLRTVALSCIWLALLTSLTGVAVLSRAWWCVELARRELHRNSIMAVTPERANTLAYYESRVVQFRKARLYVGLGSMLLFAAIDIGLLALLADGTMSVQFN
jgi:hypothetical protein